MAENKKKIVSGKLPADVSAKFTVEPGIGIGPVIHKGQQVDLTKISLAEAEELVKNGFTALVPIKGAPAPDKK